MFEQEKKREIKQLESKFRIMYKALKTKMNNKIDYQKKQRQETTEEVEIAETGYENL